MITEKEFNAYEEVRVSGVTNMFMTGNVCMLAGLSREEVKEIRENYTELKDKYENLGSSKETDKIVEELWVEASPEELQEAAEFEADCIREERDISKYEESLDNDK